MSLEKLLKLAANYEKMADSIMSAQPSDIEGVLQSAGLWNLSKDVSPMLNSAGVPDDAGVSISIVVGNKLETNFVVALTPPNPKASKTLSYMLHNKYAAAFSKALITAKLNVASAVVVKWLSF
jgi:hypothetical protein